MTQIKDHKGCTVSILPSGMSIQMSWCVMDGRSWVDPGLCRSKQIFKQGLARSSFSDKDVQIAYKTICAILLRKNLCPKERRAQRKRLAALKTWVLKHDLVLPESG